MEKLSVIIVSYNAKYYLNLTLTSLSKIEDKIELDIIVVDNFSSKNEIEFNQIRFPKVKFILNSTNLGFSKANNIGVKLAKFENILILNPDTIISESVIEDAILTLNSKNNIGAVAVKMLDGVGDFLPESVRTFPDLKSSFYKLIGLKKYSKYYRGLSVDNTIEAMSGACIFFKKSIYNQIGGFDERYFMYGEDIDISYQLNQNGYVAKYIDDKEIIHFKGKSSIKSNWRYQHSFYNAMFLYWKKNFNHSKNYLLKFFMSFIIFGLKLFSFFKHSLSLIILPLIDFIGILSTSVFFSYYWAVCIKQNSAFLPKLFFVLILPIYTIAAIFSFFISKFYSADIDISKLFKGSILNGLLTLIIYFILPTDYKYSRAVLVYCNIISILIPLFIRFFYSKLTNVKISFSNSKLILATIFPNQSLYNKINHIFGDYSSFNLLVNNNDFTDKILDISQLTNEEIISEIKLNKGKVNLWIFSDNTDYLIRLHGKNSTGLIIAKDTNFVINEFYSIFFKRIFDIVVSLFILPLSFFSKHKFTFLSKSIFKVLFKNHTWIYPENNLNIKSIVKLPNLQLDDYQRNYSINQDLYYLYRFMFIS